MKYTALRIRSRDSRNWTIEGYSPGGEVIEKGPYKGDIKKAGWDEQFPIGYFPTLVSAATRLLDEELRSLVPSEGWGGADLSAAIVAAEERIKVVVTEALEARGERADRPATLANPAAILTAEQASTVRDSTTPVETYLGFTGGKRFKRTSDETRRGLTPRDAVLERVASL